VNSFCVDLSVKGSLFSVTLFAQLSGLPSAASKSTCLVLQSEVSSDYRAGFVAPPGGLFEAAMGKGKRKGKDKGKSKGKQQRTSEEAERDRLYWVGRTLTRLCRHDESILKDEEGWAPMAYILGHNDMRHLGASYDDIVHAVRVDAKRRFEINEQDEVRAVSSWSDPVVTDEALEEVTSYENLPKVLFHGTKIELVNSILTHGLAPEVTLRSAQGSTGGRRHVHLTEVLEGPQGIRQNSTVCFVVNTERLIAYLASVQRPLYRSVNGWYMSTEAIHFSCFDKVVACDGQHLGGTLLEALVPYEDLLEAGREAAAAETARADRAELLAVQYRVRRLDEAVAVGTSSSSRDVPSAALQRADVTVSEALPKEAKSQQAELSRNEQKAKDRREGPGGQLTASLLAEHEAQSTQQAWSENTITDVLNTIEDKLASDSWQKFLARSLFREYLLEKGYGELVKKMEFESCSSCKERGRRMHLKAVQYVA
jgi:RNA:NAD 2'-phosphotransferase (TPT1/KptA family)